MAHTIPKAVIMAYDAHCANLGIEGDIEGLFRFAREQKRDCPVDAGTVKDIAKPMRILYDRMEEMSICK